MKHNWIKLVIIISIIAACLVISFIVELLFYQTIPNKGNQLDPALIQEHYANLELNDDGSLTSTDTSANITFTFPESYIYKMVFSTETNGKVIDLVVQCDDIDTVVEDVFRETFETGSQTVIIDDETDEIVISFANIEPGQVFRFDLDYLDYSAELNPIRIISIFIILLMIAYTVALVLGYVEFKYERVGLVFTLFFGFLLAFLLPPSYGYDEFAHVLKSYKTAHFDLNTQVEEELVLPEGFESLNRRDYRSFEDYQEELNKLGSYNTDIIENTAVETIHESAFSYFFLPYIFSGIGLKIAEIFNVNLFYWTAFARAGNVIFFALALYLALKIFPSNKPFIFFFAMLPMMFFSALSVGTSSMMLGCLILAICYLAYLIVEKENITWLDYGILMFLFFCVTTARMPNGIYTITALLLPNKKIKSKSLRYSNKILTLLLTLLFMGGVYLYAQSISINIINMEDTNPSEQMHIVLSNIPGFIIFLIKYSVSTLLDSGLLIYYSLILNSGSILPLVTFFMQILLIWLTLAGNKDKLAFDSVIGRGILWLAFLMSVALIETSMYITSTPVGAGTISSLHSRYILTILFIPFLTFESRKFQLHFKERTLNNVVISFALLMLICFVEIVLVKFYR